ncbi:glycosyltransferase [Granulicella sp. S190]|uniref:glycosyltransferase n=1 Tax=Granulicella sp. S190 TaxID=1747226 RepID=UPI00131D044E|nr:nucleotide disphospho-sugar-binding domain-containing protein [Granulicella sp. S190]
MSRILVAVTPLAGHVKPMMPVAQQLVKEGHQVFFQTSDIFSEQIKAAGLEFLPLIGNANYDYHRLGEFVPELFTAASPMDQAILYTKHLFADRIADQYRGLQQVIASKDIDLVMTDVLFLGELPLLLSGEPRPPVIACGVIAPSWIDSASSIFSGPDSTPEGRVRNVEENERFLSMRRPGHRYTDAVLDGLGVTIPGGFTINSIYRLPDLFLQFGTEEFEYPMEDRPSNLVYTGPIIHKESGAEAPPWMDQLDRSLPIVLVTQGTLANFDFDQLINPAIKGLAEEPVQVVVTAGGSKEGKTLSAKNAIVEPYVPYERILPMTSVFVTNGGYNGVQQALSYGVPIVCYGESEDKPLVSARVQWSGTGVSLKAGTPMPEQIRDAVRKILHDSTYAERAKTLGAQIAKSDALQTISQAVDATIERLSHLKHEVGTKRG